MSTNSEQIPPLIFSNRIHSSFDDPPTYLFRLYAPITRGTTNENEVISPARDSRDRNRDLFDIQPHHAASILNAHLRWKCQDFDDCNLMSWSSSLLFILRFGLYRALNDFDHPSLEDLRILIVDTSRFPRGTFIRDMDAIEAFKSYNNELREKVHKWRTGDLYFGEYLSQGHLDVRGRCVETTMEALVGDGLLAALCPRLVNPSTGDCSLAKAVLEVRKRESGRVLEADADDSGVVKAVERAWRCLGVTWCLPVSVMLLSLRERRLGEGDVTMRLLRENFDDEEAQTFANVQYGRESYMKQMPELGQYRSIMLNLLRGARRSSRDSSGSDDLELAMDNLSL